MQDIRDWLDNAAAGLGTPRDGGTEEARNEAGSFAESRQVQTSCQPPGTPFFEVEALMDENSMDIVFCPSPDDFQVRSFSHLGNFCYSTLYLGCTLYLGQLWRGYETLHGHVSVTCLQKGASITMYCTFRSASRDGRLPRPARQCTIKSMFCCMHCRGEGTKPGYHASKTARTAVEECSSSLQWLNQIVMYSGLAICSQIIGNDTTIRGGKQHAGKTAAAQCSSCSAGRKFVCICVG